MTETAKQDTDKATAAKAADQPAAATKPGAAGEPPAEASAPAAAAGAGAGAATEPASAEASAAEADQPDLDETKRKFRAALERKHQAQGDSQDRGGRDGSKISGAHGPAGSRRNFRRKSG
jgi:Family of unknown function (DUF5302)